MAKRTIEIRNMFVSASPNYGETFCSIYNVAILTPQDGYIEYELRFCHNRLSFAAVETIKSLLVDYRFTRESEVCMTDGVHERNPLSMYFGILAQQIGFKIFRASEKKMSARLCSLLGCAGGKFWLGSVWRLLVKSGKCKWITPAYDEYLRRESGDIMRRKRLVRVGAYYVRLRRLKYQYTLRSKMRRAESSVACT